MEKMEETQAAREVLAGLLGEKPPKAQRSAGELLAGTEQQIREARKQGWPRKEIIRRLVSAKLGVSANAIAQWVAKVDGGTAKRAKRSAKAQANG